MYVELEGYPCQMRKEVYFSLNRNGKKLAEVELRAGT
jgi:hypothetical protein